MPGKAIHPIERQVGARLRARRKELRRSQSWVAKRLGITFQQVQKYENGRNRIGASRMQQIAQVLNVPVTYFFNDAANDHADETTRLIRKFSTMPDGRALAAAYQKLSSSRLRSRVVNLVRTYANR